MTDFYHYASAIARQFNTHGVRSPRTITWLDPSIKVLLQTNATRAVEAVNFMNISESDLCVPAIYS